MSETEKPTGLTLLRMPFPAHQISKLPKETRAQIDQRKADRNFMVFNCPVCDGHHHKNAVHLDYVGHAALTDRLLDCDPHWTWEPCVAPGLPNPGVGMWITLTVCGVSRIGYGSADGKQGGDAIKEIIGDALRNAAMRFGAALDLWHKGDLHAEKDASPATITEKQHAELMLLFNHLGVKVSAFLAIAKIADLKQLPAEKFDKAKAWVNKRAKEQREAERPKTAAKTTAEAIDDEILDFGGAS